MHVFLSIDLQSITLFTYLALKKKEKNFFLRGPSLEFKLQVCKMERALFF